MGNVYVFDDVNTVYTVDRADKNLRVLRAICDEAKWEEEEEDVGASNRAEARRSSRMEPS